MKTFNASRRMFLQGAGAALAIPFLPSLLPYRAFAQAQAHRFPYYIQMGFSAGLERVFSYPMVSPTKVPYNNIETYTKTRRLQDLIAAEGQISALLGPEWNAHAPVTNLFTNSHLYSLTNLHNNSAAFACFIDEQFGTFTGYSVDHRLQEAWKKRGYAPSFLALRANVSPYKHYDSFSYGAGGKYNITKSIEGLENIVLSAATATTSVIPTASQDLTQVYKKKKVVDAVIDDYRSIINSRRISSVDKSRLQNAMDLWNDISNRIVVAQPAPGQCAPPAKLAQAVDASTLQKHAADLMVAALQCGLTNIVCHDITTLHPDFPYMGTDDNVFYHDSSHYQAANTSLTFQPGEWKNWDKLLKTCGSRWHQADGYRWRYSIVRHYLDRLSVLRDGNNEPLLNNALLATSTEYSEGDHSMAAHIVHTFGTAGGKMQTGLQVNCGMAPLQKPMNTIMAALGLTSSEVEIEGRPGWGDYHTTGDFHSNEAGAYRFLSQADLIHEMGFTADGRRPSNERTSFYFTDAEKRKVIPILNT